LRRRFGVLAHQLVVCEKAAFDQSLDAAPVESSETSRQMAEAQQRTATHAGVAVTGELRAGALGPLAFFGFERYLDDDAFELDRVVALEGSFGAKVQCVFRFRHAGSLARACRGSPERGAGAQADPSQELNVAAGGVLVRDSSHAATAIVAHSKPRPENV